MEVFLEADARRFSLSRKPKRVGLNLGSERGRGVLKIVGGRTGEIGL